MHPIALFLRRVLPTLLAVALLLPVAVTLLGGLGLLLAGLGDTAGTHLVRAVCIALGLLWLIDLVAVVLASATLHLADEPSRDSEPPAPRPGP